MDAGAPKTERCDWCYIYTLDTVSPAVDTVYDITQQVTKASDVSVLSKDDWQTDQTSSSYNLSFNGYSVRLPSFPPWSNELHVSQWKEAAVKIPVSVLRSLEHSSSDSPPCHTQMNTYMWMCTQKHRDITKDSVEYGVL